MGQGGRRFLYMKKIILLSAILLGAATASQAGVRLNFGFGFPAPPPVVVAPAAPIYIQPSAPTYVPPAPDYCPAPQAYCPPAESYCSPSVVTGPPVIDFRFGHYHRPDWHFFRDDREHRWHR